VNKLRPLAPMACRACAASETGSRPGGPSLSRCRRPASVQRWHFSHRLLSIVSFQMWKSVRWYRQCVHAALLPYRSKSQTSTIAAKLYARPWLMTGMIPTSAHFDSGQALHMLLSTYCQMDLALLTGRSFPWSNSVNGYWIGTAAPLATLNASQEKPLISTA